MQLFHSTDEKGKAGIEEHGFKASGQGDHPDCAWFQPTQDRQVTSSKDKDWWVVAELPDEVVALHRIFYDGRVDPYNIPIPVDLVNTFQPFKFERWSD